MIAILAKTFDVLSAVSSQDEHKTGLVPIGTNPCNFEYTKERVPILLLTFSLSIAISVSSP